VSESAPLDLRERRREKSPMKLGVDKSKKIWERREIEIYLTNTINR